MDITHKIPQEYYDNFLRIEAEVLQNEMQTWKSGGKTLELKPDFIEPYFEELMTSVRIDYIDWPNGVEEYLKNSPEHSRGHALFNKQTKVNLLRMAYFFGECLRFESKTLNWQLGKSGFAFESMPVIGGFSDNTECPPIAICETIIRKICRGTHDVSQFTKIYNIWKEKL